MEIIHFNQRNLATRWCVSEATLERWRTEGIGPKYLKLCGRVLDRLVDIEEYESACLMSSTSKAVAFYSVLAQVVPNSSATALLVQRTAFDQSTEMLLQRIAAGAGQLDRFTNRDTTMFSGKLDDL